MVIGFRNEVVTGDIGESIFRRNCSELKEKETAWVGHYCKTDREAKRRLQWAGHVAVGAHLLK